MRIEDEFKYVDYAIKSKIRVVSVCVGNDYTRRDGFNTVYAIEEYLRGRGFTTTRRDGIDGRQKDCREFKIIHVYAYVSLNWSRSRGCKLKRFTAYKKL